MFRLLTNSVRHVTFHLSLQVNGSNVMFRRHWLVHRRQVLRGNVLQLQLVLQTNIVIMEQTRVIGINTRHSTGRGNITAFVTGIGINPVNGTVGHASIGLAFLLRLPNGVLLVVVTFVLRFRTRQLPKHLMFRTTGR